jgi:serine/threonine protein kinase
MILEYVEGGELFDYLIEQGGLPLHQALHFFKQLLSGLEYCHRNHVCHRDLKPENLLLSADRSTLKIADFGMAALQPNEKYLATSCGSPHYASPEVIGGGKYDGKLSDVWSSGVILYALVTGRLPFDDHNVRALLLKVKAGQYSIPKYVAPEVQDLIRRMLVVDPKDRITLAEIRQHPWFTENDVVLPPPKIIFDAPDHEDSEEDSTASDEDLTPVKHESASSLSESEIDEEIVLTMTALGWTRHHVLKRLTNHSNNMEKAFYKVLEARRELPAEKYYEKSQQRSSRKFEENLTVSETARSQLLSESSEDRSHRRVNRVLVAEISLDNTESGPTSRDRMPVLVRKRSQTSTGVPLTLTAANTTRESTQVNSAPVRNSPRVRSQSAAKKSTGRKLYYHDPFIAPVQSADEIADVKAVGTQAESPKKGNWWTSLINTFKPAKSIKQETARKSAELLTHVTVSQAADVLIAYGGKITKLGKDVVRAKFGADKSSRVKCQLVFEKQADDSSPNKVTVALKTATPNDALDQICTNVCAELTRV